MTTSKLTPAPVLMDNLQATLNELRQWITRLGLAEQPQPEPRPALVGARLVALKSVPPSAVGRIVDTYERDGEAGWIVQYPKKIIRVPYGHGLVEPGGEL